MIERTLVLLKPDAVKRGLCGEILRRFENAGLKIVSLKMLKAKEDQVKKHYADALIPIVGNKTKKDWDAWGVEYTESVEEIGQMIVKSIRNMLMKHAFVAVVLEGVHAVENVRKLVGSTGPKDSPPGTIRGDFGHASLGYASTKKKGIANIIHASGNVEEAKHEISIWFKPEELFDYKSVHEEFVFQTQDW
ncbi:nucleoside-diphosphate kinase [Candidatus Woesearchaeota archaeon CG10_big_fil_rev_8_21_14_0_10_37_12]|nr:MAG: nucleoside-diphosphate kinase [Candidatus Woesearchaeota archaeon CG10_big_fil_rev_8_21_14_0_10_37_12]